MDRLTLVRVRAVFLEAANLHGLPFEFLSVRWLGQRSREKFGSDYFRVARVIVRDLASGRAATKFVTVDTRGGYRIV